MIIFRLLYTMHPNFHKLSLNRTMFSTMLLWYQKREPRKWGSFHAYNSSHIIKFCLIHCPWCHYHQGWRPYIKICGYWLSTEKYAPSIPYNYHYYNTKVWSQITNISLLGHNINFDSFNINSLLQQWFGQVSNNYHSDNQQVISNSRILNFGSSFKWQNNWKSKTGS